MMRTVRAFFNSRPVVANSMTGVGMFSFSDLLAQKYECEGAPIDWTRMRQMGALGLLCNGAGLYGWYRVLDRIVPGRTKADIAKKVLAEQILWAPFILPAQLVYVRAVQGGDAKSIVDAVQSSFWSAYLSDWMTWPPANAIAFSVVPIQVRPVFIGCVQICWQGYMSVLGHKRTSSANWWEQTILGQGAMMGTDNNSDGGYR
jgi:protein Mpv17